MGHYYSDKIAKDKDGFAIRKKTKPVYRKNDETGRYEVALTRVKYTYASPLKFFPRIYSPEPDHISEYESWGLVSGDNPDFMNNLYFFINYQLGHMYFRYFMWNFCGRQNDVQSHGSLVNGNWISGIRPIDELRLGNQEKLPDKYKNARSRNEYFMLPFIAGILGMLYQYARGKNYFRVIMLLFLMTGIAIVVYLNQTPLQPRERDYAYTGSFYAFCIWIGMSVPALFEYIPIKWQNRISAIILVASVTVSVPVIMACTNWNDHNRSGRYTARDIARNYLAGCDRNAILFTYGDNDTFPLWYIREVEGFRTDVRIVNLMLLNTEWYIDQMKIRSYESDPLPLKLPRAKYADGVNPFVYFRNNSERLDIKDLINGLSGDSAFMMERTEKGRIVSVISTDKLKLRVDREKVLGNGTVRPEHADRVTDTIGWSIKHNPLSRAALIQIDLLANNNWDRPLYFTTGGSEGTLDLEQFFSLEGLTYRLVPLKSENADILSRPGGVNTPVLYTNLMERYSWGRMNEPGINFDHQNVRTFSIIGFRNSFIRLASALITNEEMDRAVKVLDRCMELAPDRVLPFDQNIAAVTYNIENMGDTIHFPGIIELYYMCGEFEKGNVILLEYLKILKQDFDYFSSLSKRFKKRYEYEFMESRFRFNELMNLMKKYNQEFLISRLKNPANQEMKSLMNAIHEGG
jgi:hypothetical protein